MIHLQTANDADLLAALFIADAALGDDVSMDLEAAAASHTAISLEIEQRFGEGAGDRLADYTVATHMTHAEMVQAARTETGLMVEIAKGTHSCGDGPNAKMRLVGLIRKPDVPQSARCQCGRFWLKLHNTYYESMDAATAALADTMV